MHRSSSAADSDVPPAYAEYDSLFESAAGTMSAPSAPPEELVRPRPISYDLIVEWWNNLQDSQRLAIRNKSQVVVTPEHLAQIRKDYASYYPKEYFLKKPYLAHEVSASDYYIMYHFCDKMSAQYGWFNIIKDVLMELPPPYAPEEAPPSYEEANKWWNDELTAEKRARISEGASNLNLNDVRNQYRPYYRICDKKDYCNSSLPLDFYDFYLLSRYPRFVYFPSYNDYLVVEFAARGTIEAVKGVGYVAQGFGNFFANTGGRALSGGNSKARDSDTKFGDAMVGILIIAGVIVAAATAVMGALYSGAKTLASFANLAQGKKWVRSLWRLACIAGAAFGGVKAGLILGAMAGSVIPGVGTAAGAIIGAIFGGTAFAAIGAAIGKYSLQLVAYLCHKEKSDVISATNPDKWNVEKIANNLKENGVVINTYAMIEMLKSMREQKNSLRSRSMFNSLKSHVVGTDAHKEKEDYNKLLEAIQKGQDPCSRIRIDRQVCFMWNEGNQRFIKQEAALPQLKDGLKL